MGIVLKKACLFKKITNNAASKKSCIKKFIGGDINFSYLNKKFYCSLLQKKPGKLRQAFMKKILGIFLKAKPNRHLPTQTLEKGVKYVQN